MLRFSSNVKLLVNFLRHLQFIGQRYMKYGQSSFTLLLNARLSVHESRDSQVLSNICYAGCHTKSPIYMGSKAKGKVQHNNRP